MVRRSAVSALAALAAAVSSVAAAAPPTYKYVELFQFPQSGIASIELSLNDRAEIAWIYIDPSDKERLHLRSPQGFLWNPATAGVGEDFTNISLGKLGNDSTIAYTVKHAAPDPRFHSVLTWKDGSPTVEVATALVGAAESFELAPTRNKAGQLAFWRLGAAYGLMRWTAGVLEEDLASAGYMSRTLMAPDGELFFERRANVLASTSEIYRGQASPFSSFVSAADFGGIGRVHVPVDLNAAKTLLFLRPGTVGINVYFKAQGGTPVFVAATATCTDAEINDQSQVMCVASSGISLRNTSDLDTHTVVAPSFSVNGSTVEAIGSVASLNDQGQVAFVAELANGETGIYLATPDTCDSDQDGWCDSHDLCPNFAEVTQRDSDQDGFGDRCDNCPFHANPDQADSNGDGRGNVCGPCLASAFPRCGTRTKGSGNDIFTLANVPIDTLPGRPALYLLAKTVAPGLVLEATATGCAGGNLSSNGPPIPSYDHDGFQRWPVYFSYYEQPDRVGASCTLEFRATGSFSGTYSWLAEAVTVPILGGQEFYESTGGQPIAAEATAPNRATFTNETSNHRFLYAGTGGSSFGTCSFVPDPPTAQEPPVVYTAAPGPGWDCCTFQFDGFDGIPSSVGQLVFSLNGSPPPPDPDGDGFLSPCDSCKYVHNTDQADHGRVGPGDDDGIGDACQCTELTGDGIVGAADVTRLREHLARIGAQLSGAPLSRCSAIGGPNECTVRTLTVLRRALALQPPGVAQVCDAAVP